MAETAATDRRIAAVETALLRQRFAGKLRMPEAPAECPRAAELIRALNQQIAAERAASEGSTSDRCLRLMEVVGTLREIASTAVRTVRLLEDNPALVAMFHDPNLSPQGTRKDA